MKKQFLSMLLLMAALLFPTGCHEAYLEKLDELEGRADALMLYCSQLNDNLVALQRIVQTIQSQDMITGITEIRDDDNTITGYRINFVKHDPITITNGADGKKPLVSSRRDPEDGKYYWSIEYGNDAWVWLYASNGSRMSSVGSLPYVTVKDGMFVVTTDGGATWTVLGKANGDSGDQMFSDIITSNQDYVLISLSTGEMLKIPTYSAYLALVKEVSTINENTSAQTALVEATRKKMLWITSVSPLVTEGDTTGLTVSLSNGKGFNIHDWSSALSPAIFVKRDADGKLYWAYSFSGGPEKWVLSPEGNKISAESDAVVVPQVSVVQDVDGEFYWTVTTKGSTEFLRTKVGERWEPQAVDTVATIFSDIRDYTDSLVVVMKDPTVRFVLPKANTVTLTAPDGTPVTDELVMSDGGQVMLRYTAYGTNPSLTLITQGGFSAIQTTLDSGVPGILVKAPSTFASGTGKVMALFSFTSGPSPVTVVKTITIVKED